MTTLTKRGTFDMRFLLALGLAVAFAATGPAGFAQTSTTPTPSQMRQYSGGNGSAQPSQYAQPGYGGGNGAAQPSQYQEYSGGNGSAQPHQDQGGNASFKKN